MKRFEYTIRNSIGIHGRPALQVSKLARKFADTAIVITKDGKSARLCALLQLMLLGVHYGDRVTVTIDGPSEMEAVIALQNFFWNHL